ncbi:hypothetical protein CQ015_12030 [Arthrobacter sp. MYb221]|nr:hypothetical protein CQ015_12030 [Arthrobacter sp. MYb221]
MTPFRLVADRSRPVAACTALRASWGSAAFELAIALAESVNEFWGRAIFEVDMRPASGVIRGEDAGEAHDAVRVCELYAAQVILILQS